MGRRTKGHEQIFKGHDGAQAKLKLFTEIENEACGGIKRHE